MSYCTKCGNLLKENVNFCEKCGARQYQTQIGNSVQTKKKKNRKSNSTLSIISCVLTGICFIFPTIVILAYLFSLAAIAIGLIDLGMKDKSKRHLGSWFGIIGSIIILMILFI